jgi:hypothetical protein
MAYRIAIGPHAGRKAPPEKGALYFVYASVFSLTPKF